MKILKTPFIIMAMVFFLFCAKPSHADIYLPGLDPKDPDILEEYSEVVIRGIVKEISVEKGEFGIHTDYTIEVIETLKGGLLLGETIVVRAMGGRLGNELVISVEGLVSLTLDERVKMYLNERPDGLYEITFDPYGVITETGVSALYNLWHPWENTSLPVTVKVNVSESIPAMLTPERWEEMCRESAEIWADSSSFSYVYGGHTLQDTFPAAIEDGVIDIWWDSTAQNGRLGRTRMYAVSTGGPLYMVEANIAMYTNQIWAGGDESGWWDGATPGRIDILSVLAHEFGHAVGLSHSAESGEPATPEEQAAMMYWSIGANQLKRVPNDDDLGGICEMYPNFFNGFRVSFDHASPFLKGETVTVSLQALDQNGDDTSGGPAEAMVQLSEGEFLTENGDSRVSLVGGVGSEACSFRGSISGTVTMTVFNPSDPQESGVIEVYVTGNYQPQINFPVPDQVIPQRERVREISLKNRASDSDLDTLSWTIRPSNETSPLKVSITGETLYLNHGLGDAGADSILIYVTDGTDTVSQSLSVRVETAALVVYLDASERADTAWTGTCVALVGPETQYETPTATDTFVVFDTAVVGSYHLEVTDTRSLCRVFAPVTVNGAQEADTLMVTVEIRIGDANRDGVVNDMDESLITSQFGALSPIPDDRADVTNDGVVNTLDVLAVQKNFGYRDELP